MISPTLHTHPLIIPTVLIPLAAVSVGLSAVATYIAGLFGVTLKTEGPKKLLEVLLKPKIVFTAIIVQVATMGAWKGYQYFKNYPALLLTIERNQKAQAESSSLSYEDNQSGRARFFKNAGQAIVPAHAALKVLWSAKLSEKKEMGPFVGGVVSSGHVFYAADDGLVHELEISSGKTIRSFFVGTEVTPAPLIFKEKLYAGEGAHDTHHARVYQYDLKTGAFLKSFQTKGHVEGNPLVHENGVTHEMTLFTPAGSDGLYALDPESLALKWHQNEGHTDSGVTVVGERVFNGTGREKNDTEKNRSYAVAYDFHSGKVMWKRELPASSWMTPIAVKNEVCYPFGEVYFKSEVGGVACFDQQSGRPGMFYYQSAPIVSEMILLDEELVFSDGTGKICRVSPASARAVWCTQAGEAKNGKAFPGVMWDPYRNVLVYASKSSGLFILNPKDGVILTHYEPGKSEAAWGTGFASATIVPEGWMVANDAGIVRLIGLAPLQQ